MVRAEAAGAVTGEAAPAGDGHAGAASRGRLETVELGRGLAALAVVLFHANASAAEFGGPQPAWLGFGEHGVDFFFILSGFIIFAAHRDDIGVAGAGRAYLLKRAIRLLPLLWLVVIGWATLRTIVGVAPDPALVLRSLFLWPSLQPALPAVVWTLRHEALFYAVFLVLLVRPVVGRIVFAGWGVAAVGQAVAVLGGHPLHGIAAFFLSSFTLDFLLGALVAELYRRRALPRGWLPLIAAGIALIAALVLEERLGLRRLGPSDYVSPVATFWTLALGVLFAALLCGLLAIEAQVRVPRWGVALGGASYAIYLVHTPVNSLTQRLVAHLPRGIIAIGGGHLVLIVAGVAAGLLVHRMIELPVTGMLRRRLLAPPARVPDRATAILP